jgi:signal transduction histidine kinase
VANARRHASSVTVTVEHHADRAWVHVDDDGPGIPVAMRDAVFQRFARLDEGRSADRGGAGLGLAIVAGVAEAHGGGAVAADAPTGGARVSLWLPA